MRIFKRIFNKQEAKKDIIIDSDAFETLKKSDYKNLKDLIDQNAGLSFEKQLVFGDVIDGTPWELDMHKGLIIFRELEFPIQIIGSFSFNNNSWLWAWANEKSDMPKNLLVQSNKLKELGEQKGIKELTTAYFDAEENFEHKVGLAVCGLFNSKSYYCANYGQGTLLVTIDDDRIPDIDKERLEKVATTFSQLIASFDFSNHKKIFKNYLIDREFNIKASKNKIEGLRKGKIVSAEFDKENRLVSIKGKL